MAHMDTNRFNVIVRLVAPNLLENQGRGNGLAMALQQAMQQLKLQMGEPDWLLKPNGLKAFWNKGKGSVVEDFIMFA